MATFFRGFSFAIAGLLLTLQALAGGAVSYTHLRAHETVLDLVCRLLLEKKKQTNMTHQNLLSDTNEILLNQEHITRAPIMSRA